MLVQFEIRKQTANWKCSSNKVQLWSVRGETTTTTSSLTRTMVQLYHAACDRVENGEKQKNSTIKYFTVLQCFDMFSTMTF